MSFNVGDFKAKISEVGGLAKANKFAVLITPPRWTGDVNDGLGVTPGAQANLRFLCDTTNLPGKNLNTIDYMPQGFGAIHKTPIGVVHDPLSLTFLMDGNHHVMKFFQLWMQEIINTGSSFDGALASYKDRTDHEMSYKTNYVTTVILTFFSDDGNSQLEYHFADAFPVQLGSVTLGWEQNDTIAKLPVEFTYSTYTVFKNVLPTRVSGGRGPNLFQRIAQLGTIAGVINNIRKPTSVQDAINQFNNVSLLSKLF
jgi:hypothetical protein